MTLHETTDDRFDTEVLGADKPVLVEFWAPWCGPCHQLAPILEQIASERDDVRIMKLNQDENPLVSARYRVMAVPTMLLFDRGEPVAQLVGARPKTALVRELDRVLA